ncbi:MAG TPA: acetolactate synthase large subunit, partial [Candidatus Micrarchaeota archaeon]|nr:acetolactate synthase large subunit [Candidatus Micrarchaeota archaeon]
LILTRNEQTAVFMAANYGRFTGSPGIALSTLGPGATNLVTGVGYAQLNGLPVIVITGQKPIKKSKQGEFQIIDVVSMMKPLTKSARQIQSANSIPAHVRQAFKTAVAERPGAVHLELPEDIARENVEAKPMKQDEIRRPVVEDKAFRKLVDALSNAKRPIILIGAGANRKRISKYLTSFIKKYNIPFFESQMGKGVVDERLSQYVGTAALSSGDHVHKVIEHADLILAIGHDTLEKPTNFLCDSHAHTKLVHINYYEAKVDEVYHPDVEIIGDIGNLFWRLCEANMSFSWDHSAMYEAAKEGLESNREMAATGADGKLVNPQMLIHSLRKILGEKDIIALDNGWYKIWFARNYPVYHSNTLLLDNTFATMGAGLASGTIAKYLNPENKAVVVTGDGGLVMNLGDLETTVRLGIDIVILVLNNNSLGMIQIKQKQQGLAKFGLSLTNPDFARLAESFGAKGMRIGDPAELDAALQKALGMKGVVLIDVPFEYPESFSKHAHAHEE